MQRTRHQIRKAIIAKKKKTYMNNVTQTTTLVCSSNQLLKKEKQITRTKMSFKPSKSWSPVLSSSSSSCRAASTDIPDPLSPLLSYRSSPLARLQGYIRYPHIAAVCSSWSSCFSSAICGGP